MSVQEPQQPVAAFYQFFKQLFGFWVSLSPPYRARDYEYVSLKKDDDAIQLKGPRRGGNRWKLKEGGLLTALYRWCFVLSEKSSFRSDVVLSEERFPFHFSCW